jgi:hypothetical protein
LTASRGLGSSALAGWDPVEGAGVEGAREDWKCVRSAWVDFVRSMRPRMSFDLDMLGAV